MSNTSRRYDPGYPKFSRSAFPPPDYVPLTPDQVRAKIGFMNKYIHILEKEDGPNWSQKKLEIHESLFTTCARQGVEPNWDRLLNPQKVVKEGKQEAPTAVSKPPPILCTQDDVLRLEPVWPSDHNYNAYYNGERVVEGEYNPIFAACRVLLERGITGPLKVYGPNDDLRATVDIKWGATHRVTTSRSGTTIFAAYKGKQDDSTELLEAA